MYTVLAYTEVGLELLPFQSASLANSWSRLGGLVRSAKRRRGGTKGLMVAVASWSGEISREIDTDKSRTLSLPRRRLSAEGTEAAVAAAAAAAHSRKWRAGSSTARQIRKPGALADVSFD